MRQLIFYFVQFLNVVHSLKSNWCNLLNVENQIPFFFYSSSLYRIWFNFYNLFEIFVPSFGFRSHILMLSVFHVYYVFSLDFSFLLNFEFVFFLEYFFFFLSLHVITQMTYFPVDFRWRHIFILHFYTSSPFNLMHSLSLSFVQSSR